MRGIETQSQRYRVLECYALMAGKDKNEVEGALNTLLDMANQVGSGRQGHCRARPCENRTPPAADGTTNKAPCGPNSQAMHGIRPLPCLVPQTHRAPPVPSCTERRL